MAKTNVHWNKHGNNEEAPHWSDSAPHWREAGKNKQSQQNEKQEERDHAL